MRRLAAALLTGAALAGCVRRPPAPPAAPHYVVGAGYQAGGTWFYPREDFHYDRTGVAAIDTTTSGLTADGEAIDPAALTAAHPTLQLPAIAEVTNLDNGRSLRVRVNDRGPANPARLIALSPRAAALLGIEGAARVRVQVDEGMSTALREQLGGGPRLALAAVPRGAVQSESLAPPPGVGQSARGRGTAGAVAASTAELGAATVPDRLPEAVMQGAPRPGGLSIEAGSFTQAQYARQLAARLGGRVERRADRSEVRLGPYSTIAAADAALDRLRRAGVSDARLEAE